MLWSHLSSCQSWWIVFTCSISYSMYIDIYLLYMLYFSEGLHNFTRKHVAIFVLICPCESNWDIFLHFEVSLVVWKIWDTTLQPQTFGCLNILSNSTLLHCTTSTNNCFVQEWNCWVRFPAFKMRLLSRIGYLMLFYFVRSSALCSKIPIHKSCEKLPGEEAGNFCTWQMMGQKIAQFPLA